MEIAASVAFAGCVAGCGTALAGRWPAVAPLLAMMPFGSMLVIYRAHWRKDGDPQHTLRAIRSTALCAGALCAFLLMWWVLARVALARSPSNQGTCDHRPFVYAATPALLIWSVAVCILLSL